MKFNITEQNIHRLVAEAVIRLLTEDEEIQLANEGERVDDKFIFDIKGSPFATAERQLTYFITELKKLKNDAMDIGVDLSWTIKDRAEGGYTIQIFCDAPEIKLEGYELVAEVFPRKDGGFALVCPSKEYRDDFDVIEQLKATAMKAKCKRCNSSRDRGAYWVFMNLQTHELEKYGANCANQLFGIKISAKLARILQSIAQLGTGGPGGGPLQAKGQEDEINPEVTAACMLYAIYDGNEKPTKANPNWTKVLDTTIRLNRAASYDEHANVADGYEPQYYYERELANVRNEFPEYAAKIQTGRMLEEDFYNGVKTWAENMEIRTDFDNKIQSWAMFLANGRFHKKGIKMLNKTSYVKPWVTYKFLIDTKKGRPVGYGEFEGKKVFEVTITDVSKRQSRQWDEHPYWMIYAETLVNGEKRNLCWTTNNETDYRRGQTLNIEGEYARDWGESTALRGVRKVAANIQNPAVQEPEVNAGGYPTSLKNYEVTTTGVFSNGQFISVTSNDGLKYLISGKFAFIPDYALQKGAKFKVSGRVVSYISKKDGSTQYAINSPRFTPMVENRLFQKMIIEAVRASLRQIL